MPHPPSFARPFFSTRPPLPPLDGKRILVHLVVNVESWQFDQPMPRTIVTPPHGRETVPDVPNFSWADYGMRAGLPRILKAFAERGLFVAAERAQRYAMPLLEDLARVLGEPMMAQDRVRP
mgnify:CR=1 FL=1